MVQLSNPARLSLRATLGKTEATYNSAGVPVDTFVPVATIHAGSWTRSLSLQYQLPGLNMQDTVVYVVRHRNSYDGITRVVINNVAYEVADMQIEPIAGPQAYDLLTLRQVKKRG